MNAIFLTIHLYRQLVLFGCLEKKQRNNYLSLCSLTNISSFNSPYYFPIFHQIFQSCICFQTCLGRGGTPKCISALHGSLVPEEARKGHQTPETEVTGDYEPPCGFQEPNPSPLQDKQQVLLTTEPSLQSLTFILNIDCFSRALFSSLYLATCRVFACIFVCTSVQCTRRLDICQIS